MFFVSAEEALEHLVRTLPPDKRPPVRIHRLSSVATAVLAGLQVGQITHAPTTREALAHAGMLTGFALASLYFGSRAERNSEVYDGPDAYFIVGAGFTKRPRVVELPEAIKLQPMNENPLHAQPGSWVFVNGAYVPELARDLTRIWYQGQATMGAEHFSVRVPTENLESCTFLGTHNTHAYWIAGVRTAGGIIEVKGMGYAINQHRYRTRDGEYRPPTFSKTAI